MSSKRYRMKALDGRTGRLERAINLIEDGEVRGLWTKRSEADNPHPLSRPVTIGIDRAQIMQGILPKSGDPERGYTHRVGYTSSSTSLYTQRETQALGLTSGGAVLEYTEA